MDTLKKHLKLILCLVILLRAPLELLRDYRFPFLGFDINYNIVFLVILVIITLILLANSIANNSLRINKIVLHLSLFICLSGISLAYTPSIAGSTEELFRMLSFYLILPCLIHLTKNTKDFYLFLKFFVGSVAIPVAYGFLVYVFDRSSLMYYGYERLIGTFSHASTYGDYIVIFLLLLGCLRLTPQTRSSKSYHLISNKPLNILIIALLISLFLTYTRGSWVGFLLATTITLIFHKRDKIPHYLAITLPLGAAALPIIIERMTGEISASGVTNIQIAEGLYVSGSYASRLSFIFTALDTMFSNSPIWGTGIGSFFYHFAPLHIGLQVEVHNDLIKLISELGILGAAVYFTLLIRLLITFNRAYKANRATEYGPYYLAAFAMTLFMLYSSTTNASLRLIPVQFYYWTYIALALSLYNINKTSTR